MQVPWRRSDKFKKADTALIHLTPEGLRHLEEELAHLKRVLPAYIAETQRTAAYGDRSDNAEYKHAKATLRRTNYRILEVEDQLKRVSVIAPTKNQSGVVELGSTVLLEVHDGTQKTFRILGSKETNPGAGSISFESPLGAALLGKSKNDSINLETPSGIHQYRILEIT